MDADQPDLATRSRRYVHGRAAVVSLALVLVALALNAITGPAAAGQYTVRQCEGAGHLDFLGTYSQLGGTDRVDVVDGCRTSGPGKIGVYQDRGGSQLPYGGGGQFIWGTPPGVEVVGTAITSKLRNANGIRASLEALGPDLSSLYLGDGEPHDGTLRTAHWSDPGRPRTVIVARLKCGRSAGCDNLSNSTKAYFELTDAEFIANDTRAPAVAGSGQLFDWGGDWQWHRGNGSAHIVGSDVGSGVSGVYAEVNDLRVDASPVSCPGAHPGYSSRFTACPASVGRDLSLPTDHPPFQEGGNRVRFCAEDYAASPAQVNRTCTERRLVLVDNSAPAPPLELSPVGGSGWRSENGFEVVWENPPGQLSAIELAVYRVVDPDDGSVVDSGFVSGGGVDRAGPVDVPGPGEYRFEVQLLDSAGNLGAESVTTIRFDDGRPSDVRPEPAPGWVSADELPLRQTVERAQPGGPSGVGGYALAVSDSGPAHPCPGGSCLPFELSLSDGPDQRTGVVAGLSEGSHWISAVAASGAGLSSEHPGSTVVRVDKTEPLTVLEGVPGEWVNHPVTLNARATDSGSGMVPDPGNDDGSPVTVIEAEGQASYRAPGDRASFTVASDGRTPVRFWARDLAGNANDGLTAPDGDPHAPPGSAVVRIDTTPPEPAFIDRREPGDPELVRARVEDRDSGLADGSIAYRRIGSEGPFTATTTVVSGDRLEARIPSDDLAPGSYELRAEAVDRAGNLGIGSLTEGGTAMVLRLPLKRRTRLSARAIGRTAPGPIRIGYGKPAKITGRLTQVSGGPLAGAQLSVDEHFPPGAIRRVRRREIVTDGSGRYLVRLKPGPSRRVEVHFDGTRTLSDSSSKRIRVLVRGNTSFRLRPRVVRNQGQVRMSGAVGMNGALRPARGKLVAIQYFDPGRNRWRPVEVLRTNRRGRFRYQYRFRTISTAQRIFFRAAALPEGGWPYQRSTSGRKSVIVYPQGFTGRQGGQE
ncbi:MAG: hypothetical protein KDB62_06650 [Solirubrobacterales bacterium]|nr:hypothetical protein [Solirubrobacterales bacterium]